MAKQTIGEFLATLRKANGYTQQEIADRLGISNRTLSGWECDKVLPDILLLPALAELYGVTVDEILAGERKERNEVTLSGKSERRMLKSKIARFTMQSSILLGIIIAGILLSAFCSFVVATQSAGYVWPVVLLAVGAVAVVVCLGILFAFWKSLELSVDDTTEYYNLYCLILRKKLANCIFILSATSALATFITAVGLLLDVEINSILGDYGIVVVCVAFGICAVILFLTAWLIWKRGLAKFGGESACQSIRRDRKYFLAVGCWGLIPCVLAVITMILFTFWQPAMRQTIYRSEDKHLFVSEMESYQGSAPFELSKLAERINPNDSTTKYYLNGGEYCCNYVNGTFLIYRKVQYSDTDYMFLLSATKLTTKDGNFSVYNVRFANDTDKTNITNQTVLRYELVEKGDGAELLAICPTNLSYEAYIIGAIIIGLSIAICCILCVKRRLKFNVKL